MYIIYITNDFPPDEGGMEINAFYTAYNLARYFKVQIVTNDIKKNNKIFFPSYYKNLNIKRFKFSSNYILKNIFLTFILIYYKLKLNYKFIFLNTWSPFGLSALFMKVMFNVKYFITAHGMDILEPVKSKYYNPLMKIVLSNSALIFAVSNFTKNKIIEFGINKNKIKVVPNGIEENDFINNIDVKKIEEIKTRFKLHNNFVILTVSRIVERKGHLLVLMSLKKLIKENYKIKYIIAGTGEYKNVLIDYVEKNNLQDYVIFTDFIPFDDLKYIYYSSNLFVMPSIEIREHGDVEGFGISYLEANICEIPVIGLDTGGVSDVIKNNYNGLLLKKFDEDELTTALKKFINDKDYYDSIKLNCRNYCIENFNWSKNVLKLKYYIICFVKLNILYLTHRKEIGGGEISLKETIMNINNSAAVESGKIEKSGTKNFYIYLAGKVQNKFWCDIDIKKYDIDFSTIYKFNFSSVLKLIKIIVDNDINIIHCNTTRTVFYAVIANLILLKKSKIVWHNRGTDTRTDIEKTLSYFTDVMLGISDTVKEHILKQGINSAKVKRIYNGIDFSRLETFEMNENLFEKNPDYFYIGIIGRLTVEKNHITALKSLKLLVQNNYKIRLVICGDDEFGESSKNQILKNIKENWLDEFIIRYNHISNLKRLYENLDLVIVPAHREAFGRVIIESMYFKVPVIGSEVDGIKEIIKNEHNGLLYSPSDDYNELYKMIVKILEDNAGALKKILISNGYETALKFDIKNYINEIRQIYLDII